jgi:hypothetical protein
MAPPPPGVVASPGAVVVGATGVVAGLVVVWLVGVVVLVWLVGVVVLVDSPLPLLPQPTAKVSRVAPPNNAIAVLE